MLQTNQEKRYFGWSAQNIKRVHYSFTQSLSFNRNFAVRKSYSKPVIVWRSTRTDYTQRKKETRREDSIFRARERLYNVISANLGSFAEMTVFVTLTFAENRTDLKSCNADFSSFIRRLNRRFSKKVKYTTVVEFQERGAVHYHVLFYNLPFFDIQSFEKLWGHGWTNVQSLKKIDNISAYVAKYLSKDTFDKRLVGQKVFFSSRGLLRNVITRDNMAIESTLADYSAVDMKIYKNLTIEKYERKCIIDFRRL